MVRLHGEARLFVGTCFILVEVRTQISMELKTVPIE